MSYSESQVSNALVSHKNNLIQWIDDATGMTDLIGVERALLAVKTCWDGLDYGYKWDELWHRLCVRAETMGCLDIALKIYEHEC